MYKHTPHSFMKKINKKQLTNHKESGNINESGADNNKYAIVA